MSLENRIEEITAKFSSIVNWEDKYKSLIELGKNLEAMNEELKIEQNKVKGCQSQVWLFAELKEDKIILHADSDASIAKGIVALLVNTYSGSTPQEIISDDSSFIDKIGLRQQLSMSRANGLASMLKQIKFYALAYQAKLGAR